MPNAFFDLADRDFPESLNILYDRIEQVQRLAADLPVDTTAVVTVAMLSLQEAWDSQRIAEEIRGRSG